LDVKGVASYITSSNDSALVFPRIVGVDSETRVMGVLAAHLSNKMPALRTVLSRWLCRAADV
jgi:hypothetical protein